MSMAELYGSQSLKDLLSAPLQKTFFNSWCKQELVEFHFQSTAFWVHVLFSCPTVGSKTEMTTAAAAPWTHDRMFGIHASGKLPLPNV